MSNTAAVRSYVAIGNVARTRAYFCNFFVNLQGAQRTTGPIYAALGANSLTPKDKDAEQKFTQVSEKVTQTIIATQTKWRLAETSPR